MKLYNPINKKNYCVSPCARDKFQKYVLPVFTFFGFSILAVIGLFSIFFIVGLITVLILFYGFGYNIALTELLGFMPIGTITVIALGLLYWVYEYIKNVYIFIKNKINGIDRYVYKDDIIDPLKFIMYIVLVVIGIIIFGFSIFLVGIHFELFLWVVTLDVVSLLGLVINSLFLSGFVIVALAFFGGVWLLCVILYDVYKAFDRRIQNVYETKFKKECKLFVECE